MERTYEQKMAAHQRGVDVLATLAVSFGVTLRDSDTDRWLTLLSVSREIDEKWLKGDVFAGACQQALTAGEAYGESIPRELSEDFKSLYDTSSVVGKEFLTEVPHEIIRHNADIRGHYLRPDDVRSRSVDHTKMIRKFQQSLEADAEYRATLLALPLVETVPEDISENAKRARFNEWLKDFYVAYEHIGAFGHAKRDVENGRHKVEVGSLSQAWVATRSLVRCIARGTPSAAGVLFTYGSKRVVRKLTGRL